MRPCLTYDQRFLAIGIQRQPTPTREVDPLGFEFAAQLRFEPSDHGELGVALDLAVSGTQSGLFNQLRVLYLPRSTRSRSAYFVP